MAAVTYPGGSTSIVSITQAANFIPEIWSDEIVAAYKKKLVMANLVKKMSMKGKKGDTINIPIPTRGVAAAKAKYVAVTIQADTEGVKQVVIDKHYEYSRLIEDMAEVQSLSSMRKFYTDDAGYAMAAQIDSHLIDLGRSTNTASASTNYHANAFLGGDGTTTYSTASSASASALTDAAIRRTIQRLDDADAPMEDRYIVIPPAARNTLMGLSRFTEQAFTGEAGSGNTIRNGQIGAIYGMDVFTTSNAATVQTGNRAVLIFQRDAFVLAEQKGVRTQTQYKQEYLATLLTADAIYGVQILKNSATTTAGDAATAFALIIPG